MSSPSNPIVSTDEPGGGWGKSYKVGDLLVKVWGRAKTAKSRVVQVVRVTLYPRASYDYYTYTVRHADGSITPNQSNGHYQSFESWRNRKQQNIQTTNKILERQEKDYNDTFKLEEEAKKIFKSGV